MSERRCRVQGESYRLLDEDGGKMIHIPASTIPWEVAELAYPAYCANGGSGQSLERLNERGGWGRGELLWLLDGGTNMKLCTRVPRYNPDREVSA